MSNIFSGTTFVGKIIVLCLCTLGVCLVYTILTEELLPDNIHLRKSDWACSKSRQESSQSLILIGKVMVPRTVTRNICLEYTRKPANY